MNQHKQPSLLEALIPIIFLMAFLSLNVTSVFGNDSISGANQLSLLFAGAIATLVAIRLGYTWTEIQKGITDSISAAMPAILILLIIGALVGTWMLSGVVPAMVYYGLKILHPSIFLIASCIICAIVSIATGSSWTTIATIGVALIAIGNSLGFTPGLTAGAIISGAYFGDKMSPLSDTTNLAPAMAGTDLFTHIRYMMYTTIPSISIALLIFLVLGLTQDLNSSQDSIDDILSAIDGTFNITPLVFLVPISVVVMIIMKIPALPSLLIGTLVGAVFAVMLQGDLIDKLAKKDGTVYSQLLDNVKDGIELEKPDLSPKELTAQGEAIIAATPNMHANYVDENYGLTTFTIIMKSIYTKISIETSNAKINEEGLLDGKGMDGMLGTIWLIICAMIFGGVMEVSGLLTRITRDIIRVAKSTGSLIASTAGTCLFFNVTASDQYLAIVVPGRMFAKTFKDRGLAPENLSRTLEDTGTVTSVLIPWNTCGAFQAGVLNVVTGEYWMYCFFNIISPIMTVLFGFLGIKIKKLDPATAEEENTTSIHVS